MSVKFTARQGGRWYVFVNVPEPAQPWQLTDPALALPEVAGGPPKYHRDEREAAERAARIEAIDPSALVRYEHHYAVRVEWDGAPDELPVIPPPPPPPPTTEPPPVGSPPPPPAPVDDGFTLDLLAALEGLDRILPEPVVVHELLVETFEAGLPIFVERWIDSWGGARLRADMEDGKGRRLVGFTWRGLLFTWAWARSIRLRISSAPDN